MQIVGVDFGTTNVRLSTWDSEQSLPPDVKYIGAGDTNTMPAVVAFRKTDSGETDVVVGEEADNLEDEDGKTLVIRNIKRYALSSDSYVDWHLNVRNSQEKGQGKTPTWPQDEWESENRSFKVWGEDFPIWGLISRILGEAFRRAEIAGDFEWRAGCPVHADMPYREGLAQALFQVTGKANVTWISAEPILFLTLARRVGSLNDGSYLVYDVGGGSFDCALVTVKGDEMLVYGADGHPLLGGSDVDDGLTEKLGYTGQPNLLRQAKERLNLEHTSEQLADGSVITLKEVETVLRDKKFSQKSIAITRDAYVGAKILWKREESENVPPIGEIASQDPATGEVRFVWQLMWEDIAHDVDKIILFGGPTKASYFPRELSKWFGEEKIVSATDLLPTLIGTPDLELVGISMGACYSYEDSYDPLYLNRIPARVVLQDLQTGVEVKYEPFQHFDYKRDLSKVEQPPIRASSPFDVFVSEPLVQEKSDPHEYELSITYPNSVLIQDPDDKSRPARYTIDGYLESGQGDGTSRNPASSLRLIIDRFGRVGVEKHSSGPGLSWTKVELLVNAPPWQTDLQRAAARAESQDVGPEEAGVIRNIRESPFVEGYISPSEKGHVEGLDSPYRHGRRG